MSARQGPSTWNQCAFPNRDSLGLENPHKEDVVLYEATLRTEDASRKFNEHPSFQGKLKPADTHSVLLKLRRLLEVIFKKYVGKERAAIRQEQKTMSPQR